MRRTLLMSAALKRHQRRASAAEMRHQLLLLVLALTACGPVTLPENATVNINTGAMAGAPVPMAGAGAAPDGSVVRAAKSTTTRNPEDIDSDAGVDPMDDDAGEPHREPLPMGQPNDSDFDGDGIPDRVDPCPVDKRNDTDRDGKCDSQDPCPNDSLDDRDRDGLCDSDDACPRGDDSDNDGVCDVEDRCPSDPMDDEDGDGKCANVDACPRDKADDSDLDGVCDSKDACPGFRDSVDDDRDSIPDGCDPCIENGPDTDFNGVADACEERAWSYSGKSTLRYTSNIVLNHIMYLRTPDGSEFAIKAVDTSITRSNAVVTLRLPNGDETAATFDDVARTLATQSQVKAFAWIAYTQGSACSCSSTRTFAEMSVPTIEHLTSIRVSKSISGSSATVTWHFNGY